MSVRIADLPGSDRPRERLARVGPANLSDQELLALVIRSGGQGASALDVGEELLAAWGSLDRLSMAGFDDVLSIAKLGDAKAAGVVAAFELGRRAASVGPPPAVIQGPEDLVRLVQPLLLGRAQEEVVLVVVNGGNWVLRTLSLTRGATDRCLLVVRDVIATVLRCAGTGFALAHNHPSGDCSPSAEDLAVTRRLEAAAGCVGLRFLDHIIVSGAQWTSVNTI